MDVAVVDEYAEYIEDGYDELWWPVYSSFEAKEQGFYFVPLVNVLNLDSDNVKANFSSSFALDYKRPFYPLLTADTTETRIELSFLDTFDTLFLCNINFSSFTLDMDGVQQAFSAIQNVATGRYDAVCHLESGVNFLTLIIPAQTPIDALSWYNLGCVPCGNRVKIDPWYKINQKLNEPVHRKLADYQNEIVKSKGRSFHEMSLNFRMLEASEMAVISALDAAIDYIGGVVVYEYRPDKEIILLCTREGDLENAQNRVKFESAGMKIREL
ncbi:hypothetical protein KAR91_31320 [Candidatus Pacearchaeota archaeon]|nr:hypothetical protein [Candidatus Pacearchaeota archaeon]